MEWARSKNDGILPCSPYRAPDSAAIGNLVGISPLETLGAEGAERLRPTLDFLARSNLRDGLFFQRIVHTGLNPYLSVQMARAMLALGDGRFEAILTALMRRASPTWTWPEAMHPRMFGGCMGDGDHGWSAAEFASLVREMLVAERGGRLRLLEGAPAAWFKPGLRLEAAGAPTGGGTLDFTFAQFGQEAAFDWRVRREAHQDPAPLVLVLPLGYAAKDRPDVTCEIQGEIACFHLQGDRGSLSLIRSACPGPPGNPEKPIERKRYA
jgi:hypothetical protein